MTITAKITVDKNADEIYNCLLPEAQKVKRSELALKKEDGKVIITIEAEDATALRASFTSALKLLTVIEKVRDI